MCLETASQIASIISPIISVIAIASVFWVYKSQKKIDLDIEVRCDFSAWAASVHNHIDQDLLYSSIGDDLALDLDRIQTKTFLCSKWVHEIRRIILTYGEWRSYVKNNNTVDPTVKKESARLRVLFFEFANELRAKMRDQEKFPTTYFQFKKFLN